VIQNITTQLTDKIDGNHVEITSKLRLFNLRSYITEITNEKLTFLKELYEQSKKEYRTGTNYSAVYYFKAGNSIVELDINVKDFIDIKTYIQYKDDSIKYDLEHLMEMDQILHALLKKNGLQE
jgi:hypothetical protein